MLGLSGSGTRSSMASTISGDVPNGCEPPGEEIYYGSHADPSTRLTDMARRTGGVVGSICDASFENTLVRIAQALNTLRKVFPLTLKPEESTLSVLVDGVPIPRDPSNGWTFNSQLRSVQFTGTYIPPPGSKVTVQYAISSS